MLVSPLISKKDCGHLGHKVRFKYSLSPINYSQAERLNQTLEDMLRACASEFSRSWDFHLHSMEFAYNNSYEVNIGMALFKTLYGKCCKSPICWDKVGEQRLIGPELVQSTNKAIQNIRARMLTVQGRHKSHSDVRHKDLEFDVGDMVFLKVAPMKGV